MTTHNIKESIMGLVPFVAIVLEGDWTEKIKKGDTIETHLVSYKVDGLAFDKVANITVIQAKEVVS